MTRVRHSGPAIVTRYLGPTDYRGSRIAAYLEDGAGTLQREDGRPYRIVRPYDYAARDAHDSTALELFAMARADGYWRTYDDPILNACGYPLGTRYIITDKETFR